MVNLLGHSCPLNQIWENWFFGIGAERYSPGPEIMAITKLWLQWDISIIFLTSVLSLCFIFSNILNLGASQTACTHGSGRHRPSKRPAPPSGSMHVESCTRANKDKSNDFKPIFHLPAEVRFDKLVLSPTANRAWAIARLGRPPQPVIYPTGMDSNNNICTTKCNQLSGSYPRWDAQSWVEPVHCH